MADLILYAEQPKDIKVGPCTHNISPKDERFYLAHPYAKKYNNCIFCAIKAWGYMTHVEIARCLGTTRINVCLTEKRAVRKIQKQLGLSCKYVGVPLVEVYDITDPIQRHCIAEIAVEIASDFNIDKPITLKFSTNKIALIDTVAVALYENKESYHKIVFNVRELKSKKSFIETLIHEIAHAAQIEQGKQLSNQICDAISLEFGQVYLKKYNSIMKNIQRYRMTGTKPSNAG